MKCIALILVLLALGITSLNAQLKEATEKPNILLVITDQQTADAMSCAGNKYLKTPALDQIAASGVRFEQNYVTQPLCMPFRSSLQTGCYPHETGVISNGRPIQGDFPLLGNLVASAGYDCYYIGKWHVGASLSQAGYENYGAGGLDNEKADAAVDFLGEKHKKPFFLTVSFLNPHNVCQLARADADGSDLPDGPIEPAPTDLKELPPLPANFAIPENEPTIIRKVWADSQGKHYPTANWDELIWRQYLWGYYRLVEKVDAEIGKVMNALKEGGYDDNTIIIFTSDHGEGVAMHHWNQKQILYEEAVRTPLIINFKGKTKQEVYPELVSNALDIPATILDIVGVEKPSTMRGVTLVPVLEGKSPKVRDFVASETMFASGDRNLGATGRMIRTKDFKYIIYDNGEKREQLFDMKKDPGEMNNLVYNKKYKAQLEMHRELIAQWAKETNDTEFPYFKP